MNATANTAPDYQRRLEDDRTMHALDAKRARQELADAAATTDALRLVQYVHAVVKAEAAVDLLDFVLHIIHNGGNADAARQALVRAALESPGDEWSGRTNDAQRVHNDARRDAIRAALDTIPA